jgi:subtilisin-like proprotein convertase family protein
LTIPGGEGGTIADVNVLNLVGTHTFMGDLDFNIESPGATSVQIMERRCGTAENFDLNLDDEAAPGDWPCPPTDGGTYQPTESLAAFAGEDSTGLWTLTINDNAGGDSGQLDSWSLEICIESDRVFADGFESGNTSGWSHTVQ